MDFEADERRIGVTTLHAQPFCNISDLWVILKYKSIFNRVREAQIRWVGRKDPI